jgi:hypothetical protein
MHSAVSTICNAQRCHLSGLAQPSPWCQCPLVHAADDNATDPRLSMKKNALGYDAGVVAPDAGVVAPDAGVVAPEPWN